MKWRLIFILLIIGLIANGKEVDKGVIQRPVEVELYSYLEGYLDAPKDSIANQPLPTTLSVVSAYNSVPEQTDDSPCIGAGGYICERDDVVACPRSIPLYTKVEIDGVVYECFDRMNIRYESAELPHFDIYMGKDIGRAFKFGRQTKTIIIYDKEK